MERESTSIVLPGPSIDLERGDHAPTLSVKDIMLGASLTLGVGDQLTNGSLS